MKYGDAQVGEVINVWLSKDAKCITVDANGGKSTLVPALVLKKENGGITIGWKSGQETTTESYATKLTPEWEKYGIVLAHTFGDHCECEPTILTAGKEICPQCGELH